MRTIMPDVERVERRTLWLDDRVIRKAKVISALGDESATEVIERLIGPAIDAEYGRVTTPAALANAVGG